MKVDCQMQYYDVIANPRRRTTADMKIVMLPGTEHMIVNCDVKSWKRQRSCMGTLHDDDDDDI